MKDTLDKKMFPRANNTECVNLGSLSRVPENVSFLADTPGAKKSLSVIDFKWHAHSQHISIENFQPPSYYEDYLMTTTYSETMQALQCSQLEKLVGLHEHVLQSLVEIGCGDGSFLKHARQHVPRILGIEPSRRFANEAVFAGFEVLVGYVGSKSPLTSEKFDSFVSRQVFEHLPDPCDVLIGIRQMLNPGAVGLIEVPNGQRALRLKRFYEFFPDHVNYYSVNSLVALASDAGFNVMGCHESFGGDYLELWLRYEPFVFSWLEAINSCREQICATLANKVTELAAQKKRIAVWGCGAKTLSILAASPDKISTLITAVIDSDPHKHGHFVPNTAIPVISPEQGCQMKPDVVFVLALSYREEIATAVRQHIPDCHCILTLDDHGQISEL